MWPGGYCAHGASPSLPRVLETPDDRQEVNPGAGQSQHKGEAWEPPGLRRGTADYAGPV